MRLKGGTIQALPNSLCHGIRLGFLLLVTVSGNWATQDAEVGQDISSGRITGPYFLPGVPRDVVAAEGQTAYLHCRVAHIGDVARVSWIRQRDLHVISAGFVVFASDQRYRVIHPATSDNWTLQIKYAQQRDSGAYECQVNTEPKISMAFYLTVVESRASIQGPGYVKAGSTINLTCIINQVNVEGLVYWYRDQEILDYEGPVSILTQEAAEGTTSRLTIRNATPRDSGNYTCWPTSARPTSVLINVVLEGEQPAAMQTGVGSRTCSTTHLLWMPLLSLTLALLPGHR
ncbi:zwei Ig domain protein zig-8-like isoform X1 [Penaeus chinensis]|uniref:zwei Ig domain protein zig-8-like isoform X1 n=1 Tax=Penaeus chinensis TaxID=139456 RepID=UPI001FB73721|nr:zwei Ig domain protein zig-8-like isoform X1 [Penaeus chinensis]